MAISRHEIGPQRGTSARREELLPDGDFDFEALVAPHYSRLVRRLTLIVRDPEEAKDLAQVTLLRAFQAWPTVDRGNVGPWLFTIGTRLALNEIRRRKRRPWWTLEIDVPANPGQIDSALWDALGELRQEERAALVLAVLGGFSYAEIAIQLGVPEGTAASWISRAKGRLRESLAKET
jgi:RNA polymerase sigma-70 factor (ECF subfamily)